jgi:hypothetical protein
MSNGTEDENYHDNDKGLDNSKRRISNITATSISSFPESALTSDSDYIAWPCHSPLVNNKRVSPLSLRPPLLQQHHRFSRRRRSRGEDHVRNRHDGNNNNKNTILLQQQEKQQPLVLLHVTVLPPRLPWNRAILDTSLPPQLHQQFRTLAAATSGLVAQRGILIAHPREEFEVLEESVLEALSLLSERIGYDGQYQSRSPGINDDHVDDDDDDDEEQRHCQSCQRIHGHDAGWHTRIYAANGLMSAGAWAACWSEMERVDVEILPCISPATRQRLDEAQVAQDNKINTAECKEEEEDVATFAQQASHETQTTEITKPQQQQQQQIQREHHKLPPIYHAKDIPMSLLLRNYIHLLLRGRQNLVIASVILLTLLATASCNMTRPSEDGISTFKAVLGDAVTSYPCQIKTGATIDKDSSIESTNVILPELEHVVTPVIESLEDDFVFSPNPAFVFRQLSACCVGENAVKERF